MAVMKDKAKEFESLLQEKIFGPTIWSIIQDIANDWDLYIFSGIIRDFLTGNYNGFRDVDMVIAEGKHLDLFMKMLNKNDNVNVDLNRFGGFKISFNNIHIDIWKIENTWGIVEEGKKPTVDALIDSAFFNFQAIVYSIRQHKFIFHDDFNSFLKTRVMGIVYDKNPNVAFCIVNTYRYHIKYNYGISQELALWLKTHYKKDKELLLIQERRFGQILYPIEDIDAFINTIKVKYKD